LFKVRLQTLKLSKFTQKYFKNILIWLLLILKLQIMGNC
jgi:hypothetical protein